MKIINVMTLRYLLSHKKRSILTILCIIVSVLMMSCVGIAFSSGKDYYKSYIEKTEGDYHYYFGSSGQNTLDILKNDSDIDEVYFSQNLNLIYDNVEISTLCGDNLYFQKKNFNDYIVEGRLPTNKNEIVINDKIFNITHTNKNIGDIIIFDNNQEYKIVGFMDFYQTQEIFSESYQALTYVDFDKDYSVYVRDKDVSQNIFQHMSELEMKIKDTIITSHSTYLAIQNIFQSRSSENVMNIYKIVYIIFAIIVLSSIAIIYQAFQLSVSDRIQYLGMLSSVGATPKQKKYSIYYEGFILSIISIPIGLIISFIGIQIAFFYVNQMPFVKNIGIFIQLKISFSYIFFIIISSLITIFIALFIPARQLSRISIMDALKKSNEIKINKKKLRVKGLFGYKTTNISSLMALKNYKRQGKRSKIIVISFSLSIIMFLSMYIFSNLFFRLLRDGIDTRTYDLEVHLRVNEIEQFKNVIDNISLVNKYWFEGFKDIKLECDEDYFTFPYSQDNLSINVRYMNNEDFQKICRENNIVYSKNLALVYNDPIYINIDGENILYDKIFKKMDKNFFKNIYTLDFSTDVEKYYKIEPFDDIKIINSDNLDPCFSLSFLVTEDYFIENFPDGSLSSYVSTDYPDKVEQEFKFRNYQVWNEDKKNNIQLYLMDITELSIYSFTIIMIFFSCLNIINLMIASIDQRKKEFAMMMSIGMSIQEIKRMLWKESFIYGIKAAFYSFPFCLFLEWGLHSLFYSHTLFIPSIPVYIVTISILVIILRITFEIGLNRFKKQNIIETLKDDM